MAVNISPTTGGNGPQLSGINNDLLKNFYADTSNIDTANLLRQIGATGAQTLANTGLANQGAANVAGIQGQTQRDVAGITGGYGLANTALGGQYGLAGEGLKGQYANQAAQIAATPGMIQAGIAADKYQTLSPYVKSILSQVSPLLSDIGSTILNVGGGGGNAPYTNAANGFQLSNGITVPSSVISPMQQRALVNANARQGNAGVLNDVNALREQDIAAGAGTGSALERQLTGQMTAQNRSNLANAATTFAGAISPMNAQQALSAGQLQELGRSNRAQEYIKQLGLGTSGLRGLADLVTGVGSGGLGLGGV